MSKDRHPLTRAQMRRDLARFQALVSRPVWAVRVTSPGAHELATALRGTREILAWRGLKP